MELSNKVLTILILTLSFISIWTLLLSVISLVVFIKDRNPRYFWLSVSWIVGFYFFHSLKYILENSGY